MLIKLLVSILFFSYSYALDAHVHGVVNIDIAVEKNKLLLMVKSPADSLLGFEYSPRTKSEKDTMSKVKSLLTQYPQKLFKGEKLKSCTVSSSEWEHEFSGRNHSSIFSETYLKCNFKLVGTKLRLSIFELFSRVKLVNLQVLSEKTNLSKKIKEKNFEIKL